MRYLIAMVLAVIVGVLVTLYVSPHLASLAVSRFSFDSPDEVGNLEDGVYMLSNLLAVLVGWVIGWFIGGRIVKPHAPPA